MAKTEQLLRLPAVENLVGYKRSTIYRLIQSGKFPAPVPLGARAVAWPLSLIESWVQDRIRESRNGKARAA